MTYTSEQWSRLVIAAGAEYAAGHITFAELERRLTALRTDEAMALIDAEDKITVCAGCGVVLAEGETEEGLCGPCHNVERGEVVPDDCPY